MTYVIGDVASLTGIPRNTISAWERRYALLQPTKDPETNHRLYSEADVAMLKRVKEAIAAGKRVSEAVRSVRASAE